MALNDQHATLVRGADGILYEVSGRTGEAFPAKRKEVSATGTKIVGPSQNGSSDHAASRIFIDPGDHAASRIFIDPGDHAASRIFIDPGDQFANRV